MKIKHNSSAHSKLVQQVLSDHPKQGLFNASQTLAKASTIIANPNQQYKGQERYPTKLYKPILASSKQANITLD
jgi:hypothetical protein